VLVKAEAEVETDAVVVLVAIEDEEIQGCSSGSDIIRLLPVSLVSNLIVHVWSES